MGACCTKDERFDGFTANAGSATLPEKKRPQEYEEEDDVREGEGGARVRLKGSSTLTSMFTHQGHKGVNQDAMTVWENFGGEQDTTFCAVFDGHGPSGHKVARHIRDNLPMKLFSVYEAATSSAAAAGVSSVNELTMDDEADTHILDDLMRREDEDVSNRGGNSKAGYGSSSEIDMNNYEDHDKNGNGGRPNPNDYGAFVSSWKTNFEKSFKEMDRDLSDDSSIDSYCSGTTAVTVLKKGKDLIIGNLGDSRAVLFTRGSRNQLLPLQLTVDLKPSLPKEAERIKRRKGRVFALQKEPDVLRVWMPEENCPGLAMARAFGDFCLKEYGLISVPQISYRKITARDEFLVLATDGVWDVLTNDEVMRIVATAKTRSVAARRLVQFAVRAWRTKHPSSRLDDCAVICLFLKPPPQHATPTQPQQPGIVLEEGAQVLRSLPENGASPLPGGVVLDHDFASSEVEVDSVVGGSAVDGESIPDSIVNLPRYGSGANLQKQVKEFEDAGVQC